MYENIVLFRFEGSRKKTGRPELSMDESCEKEFRERLQRLPLVGMIGKHRVKTESFVIDAGVDGLGSICFK